MNEEKLNQIIRNWEVKSKFSEEEAWETLRKRNLRADKQVISIRRGMGVWIAAASFALVAFAAWMAFASNDETVFAEERKEVILPDGSVVRMQAGSEISFDVDQWEQARQVALSGEAMFEVKKGSTFTVETANGEVSVLGTSFNVFSDDEHFHVDCFSGKVKVAGNNSEQILTRGLATKMRDGALVEPFEHGNDAPIWMSGLLNFVNADLSRVVNQLAADYQVSIELNLKDTAREITGDFTGMEISDAMSLIAGVLGLQLEGNAADGFVLNEE